jgi:hypothetical protein
MRGEPRFAIFRLFFPDEALIIIGKAGAGAA